MRILKNHKPRLKSLGLRLLATAFVLAGLIYIAGQGLLLRHLRHMELGWVAGAGAAIFIATTISAIRWQLVLKALRLRFSAWECLEISYIGTTLNLVVPGSYGGEAYRAWQIGRKSRRFGRALLSVVTDRIMNFLVLILLAAPTLLIFLKIDFLSAVLICGTVVGCAIVFIAFLNSPAIRRRLRANRFGRIILHLTIIVMDIRRRPGRCLAILVTSFGAQIANIAALYAAFYAVSAQTPLWHEAAFIVLAGIAGTAIPLGVAGLGFRESAMTSGLVILGMDVDQAAAVAVIFGFATLMQAIPGGAIALWKNRGALKQGDASHELS